MTSLPVIILGAGGHAKVLIDALTAKSIEIIGLVSPDFKAEEICGVPIIGDDNTVFKYPVDKIQLANGVGSSGDSAPRIRLYQLFKNKGYTFTRVIHPAAIIAAEVKLLEGTQIMAGAIVQPGVTVGCNVIINTKTSVDHDCIIGDHVHLAPGVTLSGGVNIGEGAFLGTGVTVIQNIQIGVNSLIGAGAVVVDNVPAHAVIVGVPGKIIKYR